jgi:hypothetical protein
MERNPFIGLSHIAAGEPISQATTPGRLGFGLLLTAGRDDATLAIGIGIGVGVASAIESFSSPLDSDTDPDADSESDHDSGTPDQQSFSGFHGQRSWL